MVWANIEIRVAQVLFLVATVVSVALMPMPQSLVSVILAAAMLSIAVSDFRSLTIPDTISLPAIPLGLTVSGNLVSSQTPYLCNPEHVLAAITGFAGLFTVRWIYEKVRGREGLGLGDVKLAAVAGAWTGLEGLLAVITLAASAALMVVIATDVIMRWRDRGSQGLSSSTEVPLGVFLAPAIWVQFLRNVLS